MFKKLLFLSLAIFTGVVPTACKEKEVSPPKGSEIAVAAAKSYVSTNGYENPRVSNVRFSQGEGVWYIRLESASRRSGVAVMLVKDDGTIVRSYVGDR